MAIVASVVVYPLSGLSGLDELVIDGGLGGLMLVGLLTTSTLRGRALLLGLWAGYVVFGLAFTVHISTHAYYSLPLVPIVALTIGPAARRLLAWLSTAPVGVAAACLVAACLVGGGAGWKVEQRFTSSDYRREVDLYQRIGVAVGHTTAGVHVDNSFDTPLLYYAWISSSPLYYPGDLNPDAAYLRRQLLDITARSGKPRYLIITAMQELRSQQSLQQLAHRLRFVSRTRDYVIYAF
jgi:hypothetical protein